MNQGEDREDMVISVLGKSSDWLSNTIIMESKSTGEEHFGREVLHSVLSSQVYWNHRRSTHKLSAHLLHLWLLKGEFILGRASCLSFVPQFKIKKFVSPLNYQNEHITRHILAWIYSKTFTCVLIMSQTVFWSWKMPQWSNGQDHCHHRDHICRTDIRKWKRKYEATHSSVQWFSCSLWWRVTGAIWDWMLWMLLIFVF